MARIIAIDYGTKKTGLAVTDPLQITANGLDTVPTHEVLDYLQKYISHEVVEKFVLGLPKQADGSESESMQYIRSFAIGLQRKFPEIELVYEDERFTSVLAHQAILSAGLKKSDRRNKALVDKISATIILQSYLERTNNKLL